MLAESAQWATLCESRRLAPPRPVTLSARRATAAPPSGPKLPPRTFCSNNLQISVSQIAVVLRFAQRRKVVCEGALRLDNNFTSLKPI